MVPGKGKVTVRVARVAGETVTFEYDSFKFRRISSHICSSDLRAFLQGKISEQTPKVIVSLNLLQFIIRQAPNL